ncbi:MAG: hypothetical protein ACC653_04915, partial [Gammaproteobacteria bacterium]
LKPQMQAAIVNRMLYSLIGNRGYRYVIPLLAKKPDIRASLHRQYQFSWFKRLLLPLATYQYKSKRHDKTCDHIDCNCIWCRCGG